MGLKDNEFLLKFFYQLTYHLIFASILSGHDRKTGIILGMTPQGSPLYVSNYFASWVP